MGSVHGISRHLFLRFGRWATFTCGAPARYSDGKVDEALATDGASVAATGGAWGFMPPTRALPFTRTMTNYLTFGWWLDRMRAAIPKTSDAFATATGMGVRQRTDADDPVLTELRSVTLLLTTAGAHNRLCHLRGRGGWQVRHPASTSEDTYRGRPLHGRCAMLMADFDADSTAADGDTNDRRTASPSAA